jgi:hypothetical protein
VGRAPVSLETTAAALAEVGEFPRAVAAAEAALRLARSSGQAALVQKIQSELDLYRAGRPCRETPRVAPPAERAEASHPLG